MKTAYVFPGQASQYVGMGKDLAAQYPQARAIFSQADQVLASPISDLCFNGPENILTDTVNAQPALLTHSIAVSSLIKELKPNLTPAFVAGHSLGEYSALCAAGVLSFPDALLLVRERGRAMKDAGMRFPGMMAAVLGMDESALALVCEETGAEIANHNAPGQIVISGPKDQVENAIALAKTRGARRVIPLAVSIASHSRCMQPAVQDFARVIEKTLMYPPNCDIISNVTAEPLKTVDEIRTELVTQLTSPVQWTRSIQFLVDRGVTQFLEVGPKDVLAGLIRRINSSVHAISIGDVASVKAFLESPSRSHVDD